MIKAVIFDLGGVIAFNDLNVFLKAFAKELKIDFDLLKQIEKENHEKLILGKISVKEFCNSIRTRFDLEYDSLTLMTIWEKVYSQNVKMNTDLFGKIIEIKKKFKIGLISNLFDVTAQYHQRQKMFFYFKPALFLSCRVGLAKPDPKIFERAISVLGVKGSEILYIDDNEEYFKAVKKLGMKTLKFEDNKQVLKELRKLKIL